MPRWAGGFLYCCAVQSGDYQSGRDHPRHGSMACSAGTPKKDHRCEDQYIKTIVMLVMELNHTVDWLKSVRVSATNSWDQFGGEVTASASMVVPFRRAVLMGDNSPLPNALSMLYRYFIIPDVCHFHPLICLVCDPVYVYPGHLSLYCWQVSMILLL